MRPTILAAAAAEEGRTMRLRFFAGLIIASLFLVFMGDRTAHAQGFPFFESYPYANPYPSGRPSYYPGAPVQPDARRPVYREERRVRRPVYREERQARRLLRLSFAGLDRRRSRRSNHLPTLSCSATRWRT